jgi:tetratricopeptide (TPR) repeat protein
LVENLLEKARLLYFGRMENGRIVDQDLRGALALAKRALMCDPSRCDTLLLTGVIGVELGDYSKGAARRAIALYDRAIAIQPRSPEPYTKKAEALFFSGRKNEALPVAKRAWKLALKDKGDPDDIWYTCDTLVGILIDLGRQTEAKRVLWQGRKICRSELMDEFVDYWTARLGEARAATSLAGGATLKKAR